MKIELGKKEIEFILMSIDEYWETWNIHHEDNLKDANVSKQLKEKLKDSLKK